MKVTELMLNDIVYIDGAYVNCLDRDNIRPFYEVHKITLDDFVREAEEPGCHFAEMDPIPIKGEFLLNNGFTVDDVLLYENGNVLLAEGDGCWEFSYWDDDKDDNSICDFPIKYVYQLQHLLRECGMNELANNMNTNNLLNDNL